jgi:hypothetical protein
MQNTEYGLYARGKWGGQLSGHEANFHVGVGREAGPTIFPCYPKNKTAPWLYLKNNSSAANKL